jgi:hypothetical protein
MTQITYLVQLQTHNEIGQEKTLNIQETKEWQFPPKKLKTLDLLYSLLTKAASNY